MTNSKTHAVSVVIPNWNGASLLLKNLPKVIEAKKNSSNNISEIIVIDDGSTDDSIKVIKNNFNDEVKLVRHVKNKGFAAAVNTGFRQARNPIVCLLNTDVIPSKDFLKKAIKYFEDKKIFAVGLHEKGYGPSTAQFTNGIFAHGGGKETETVHISMWASGGSALFSRSIWWKLHGLDEQLFAPFYWEDVDIGYRAWKRGYKIYWEPSADVVHAHESVINVTNFKKKQLELIKERNELLFIWKNITSNTMTSKHRSHVFRRVLNHPGYIMVVFMALKKKSLVNTKRSREKRESKLSDEAVFSLFK